MGALDVFNLNISENFFKAIQCITKIRHFANQKLPIVLIGNQTSSTENSGVSINKEEIQNFVKKEKLMYIETSTTTGVNIENIFL